MSFLRHPKPRHPLVRETERIYDDLQFINVESEEYADHLALLERLDRLIKGTTPGEKMKKDTILLVCGNLLGIAIMTGFERFNTVPNKAFTLLVRPKTPTIL
jgi:hypothetical protein